jgi:hypothetical protein
VGSLSGISVENLDRQTTAVRERVQAGELPPTPSVEAYGPATGSGPAVIAVAPGKGLGHVFETLGASAVVVGGQGVNPSAGELAEAIRASGAAQVIVLPNNANVRLAAVQAGELCPDIEVAVVPTRNAGEGVAALLAFDPELALEPATRLMAEAARGIQTMEVTRAVRDARIGRRKVRRGQYIVLGEGDGLIASDRDRTAAVRAGIAKLRPGFELLTIYRGQDVDHDTAEQLRGELSATLPEVEIELVDGGQPHYDFLISAE